MRNRFGRERGFDGPPRPPFGGGFPGGIPGGGPFRGGDPRGGFGFPGRGGPHERHGHGRGRGRQRRGNIRAAALLLLAERPMHGYEMIQEIGQRSDGLWRPSPGSIYPTLQLLADEGLVTSAEEAGGKKLFSLTDAGRAELEKLDPTPPWAQVTGEADPVELKLRDATGQLFVALRQMGEVGTPDQKARTVDSLNEARRQVYAILGELAPNAEDGDDTDPDEG
jgi:DNA-binding PadR family transcriptional regulator